MLPGLVYMFRSRLLPLFCDEYRSLYYLFLIFVYLNGFLSTSFGNHAHQTVIGCGGLIRWHTSVADPTERIAFHRIKVNLHSEQNGALKDVSEVLPNGAFSVPVYDLGSYRLSLAAPMGWHFSPLASLIDLRSDLNACSRDFNFGLLGFTVYGQVVTFGLNSGPSGLVVRLTSKKSEHIVQQNTTQKEGMFSLAPVPPGVYDLVVSDGGENGAAHIRSRMSFVVNGDSVVLKEPIVLMGNFIRGGIQNFEGQPLSGVNVYLLAKTSSNDRAQVKCNRITDDVRPKFELPTSQFELFGEPICLARTDETGQFSFDGLPGGQYVLVPYHFVTNDGDGLASQVSFVPQFTQVVMEHTDVELGPNVFRSNGFKLPRGQVLWTNGKSVVHAKVHFVGETNETVMTDVDGFYQPGFLKVGQYSLKVEADGAIFPEQIFQLTAKPKRLPIIQPSHLSICGIVDVDVDPASHMDQIVAFISITGDSHTPTLREKLDWERDGRFRFCSLLAPGQYVLRPDIRISNQQIDFFPATLRVALFDEPISDVTFTRFRAHLVGRLVCVVPGCSVSPNDQILFARLLSSDRKVLLDSPLALSKTDSSVALFEFTQVLPGDYQLGLVHRVSAESMGYVDGLCWKSVDQKGLSSFTDDTKRILRIQNSDLDWNSEPTLNFITAGFIVPVQLENEIVLDRLPPVILSANVSFTESNDTASIQWKITEYNNKICLPSPAASYRFFHDSSCLVISDPQPSVVLPQRELTFRLADKPVLRMRILEVPVLIRLIHRHTFVAEDRLLLAKSEVVVDALKTTTGTENQGPVKKTLFTEWLSTDDGELYASAILLLAPNETAQLQPRTILKSGRKWSYTHLTAEPKSLNVKLPSLSGSSLGSMSTLLIPDVAQLRHTDRNMVKNCGELFEGQVAQFIVDIGVLLRGQIQPAVSKVEVELYWKSELAGVFVETAGGSFERPLLPIHAETSVTVESSTTHNNSSLKNNTPIETTQSDHGGSFVFGPVSLGAALNTDGGDKKLPNPTDLFDVRLKKPGYEFSLQSSDSSHSRSSVYNWLFKATKLSLVEVMVSEKGSVDGGRQPIQGVLISIIGEGHRDNQFTDQFGVANVVGLAPGQYYLRAMMKEHAFSVKNSQSESYGQASPITITEGVSLRIEITGERVAFSASGVVHGLGGLPVANVSVEAEWLSSLPHNVNVNSFNSSSNSSCPPRDVSDVPREQSWTNSNGEFRLRGLLPGCYYSIAIQTLSTMDSAMPCPTESTAKPVIERSIPPAIHILQPAYDVNGLSFVVIPHMMMSTLTVDLDAEDQFVPFAHLTLFHLDRPDSVLMRHNFADSLLFRVPGSKMCSIVGRDIVMRLENSLDSAFYTNLGAQQIVIRLKSDVSEHYTFKFRPKQRVIFSKSPKVEL